MKKIFFKFLVYSFIFAFSIPTCFSASLHFDYKTSSFDIGENFFLSLYIDTENQKINTISTILEYNPEYLEYVGLESGNSIVSFWVEKKEINLGKIIFSGMIPGGFAGDSGEVLRVIFKTKNGGDGEISFKDTKAYLNDGFGTEISLKDQVFSYRVSNNNFYGKNDIVIDKEPPESFNPEISRSEALFNNMWFLVFSTKDKGSGLSYYLIKEAKYNAFMFFQKWQVVESPYILKDQTRKSQIVIKAVDREGNGRIEKLLPQNPTNNFMQTLAFFGAIIFLVSILFFLVYVFIKIYDFIKTKKDL